MKITRKTKWAEFVPFANEERIAQIREKITDCAIFDFWGLSIGEFSPMLDGGVPAKLSKGLNNATVHEAIKIINACGKFLKEFENAMKSTEVEMTADETKALSMVTIQLTPIENLLTFAQGFFGLKDFGEAEKITLIEYYIAKKKSASDAQYQRALTHIQTHKKK